MNFFVFKDFVRVESLLGVYISDTTNRLAKLIEELLEEGDSPEYIAELLSDSIAEDIENGLAVVA